MSNYIFISPIGQFLLSEENNQLIGLDFFNEEIHKNINIQETPLLKKTAKQLDEYFAGKRKNFDLPLNPKGSEFQKKAWNALIQIPYGEVRSYKEQACICADKNYARAIGGANNKNPIAIIIPCHRVVGCNGLGGYAGGLEKKQFLLELEKKFSK